MLQRTDAMIQYLVGAAVRLRESDWAASDQTKPSAIRLLAAETV
jgi:hypothetical protein